MIGSSNDVSRPGADDHRVNRLDMLDMAPMWAGKRPRVTELFNRIKARATFKPAFLDRCPPNLTDDL